MNITMFDTAAADYSPVPADAQAIAPYMDLRFANVNAARARFPHLFAAGRVLTLTAASGDADGIDWEPGNFDPPPRAWYRQQRRLGRFRPCFYADLSDMKGKVLPDLGQVLSLGAAGPTRPVRVFTAHPTGKPHICGPQTCGQLEIDADATQYWWTSIQGRFPGAHGDVDVSLCRDDFFATKPSPPLPIPPTPEGTMALVVTQNHDGRLEVFVELQSGEVKHIAQQAVNGDWWKDANGQFTWLSLGNPSK